MFSQVDDLPSGPMLKPNDVFVECHLGSNEPCRTRVHNNAGSNCIIKETFQLNVDLNRPEATMSLFIKDQSLIASSVLARLSLSTKELMNIEQTIGGSGSMP